MTEQIYRSERIIDPQNIKIGDTVTQDHGRIRKVSPGKAKKEETILLSNHGKLSSRPIPNGGEYEVTATGSYMFGKSKCHFVEFKEK